MNPRRSAEPDRRLDHLDGAAVHPSLDDALSGAGTDVGVEQVDGDAAQDMPLQIRAEKPYGQFQRLQGCRVEALFLPGRERDDGGPGLIEERQGIHDVIGRAGQAQFLEQRHVKAGCLKPAAERPRGFVDDTGGTVQIRLGGRRRGPIRGVHRQALVRPDMLPAAHLRMQYLQAQRGAPDRNPGPDDLLAEAGE